MRANHVAGAFIVALSAALLSASCVESQPAPPEVDAAAAIGTKDDGGCIGSESPASGGWSPESEPDEMATMAECYAAGKGGRATREAFCRDECPQEKKQ